MGNALHQITIAHDAIDGVVYDLMTRAIKTGRQESLGYGHPHTIGKTLTQWPRGRLNPLCDMGLRMAGCLAAPLPKVLEILKGQIISREV